MLDSNVNLLCLLMLLACRSLSALGSDSVQSPLYRPDIHEGLAVFVHHVPVRCAAHRRSGAAIVGSRAAADSACLWESWPSNPGTFPDCSGSSSDMAAAASGHAAAGAAHGAAAVPGGTGSHLPRYRTPHVSIFVSHRVIAHDETGGRDWTKLCHMPAGLTAG